MRRGHRMEVPANSAQSWLAAFTASYDDAELDLLLTFIRPRSLVLDIGASLGFYAVPLADAVRHRGGCLVAVEPVTQNCEVLRRNFEINGLTDAGRVLPLALGDEEAEVLLHVEAGGTGNATIVSGLSERDIAHHDHEGGTLSAATASVRRLDTVELPLGDQYLGCSVIKMDAEGYEIEILRGASRFIRNQRPVIFGEFHPEWLKARGVAASEPQRWAQANNYECMELVYTRKHALLDLERVTLRRITEHNRRSGRSLLFLPGEDDRTTAPEDTRHLCSDATS